MKTLLLLLCVLYSTTLYADNWEVGFFGSGLIGHGDLGYYWKRGIGGGIEVSYPFHEQVPVILSVHLSNHEEIKTISVKKGHIYPDRDILLMHTALQWHYRFFPNIDFHPIIGAGLSHTLFIMYQNWPPEDNADESEYGAVVSLGGEWDLKKKFRLFVDYRFSAFLTEPEIVTLSLFRTGIRYIIPKRSHEKK